MKEMAGTYITSNRKEDYYHNVTLPVLDSIVYLVNACTAFHIFYFPRSYDLEISPIMRENKHNKKMCSAD